MEEGNSAGAGRQQAIHHRGAGWGAKRARCIGILEDDAGLGQPVEMRRFNELVTVSAEIARRQLIGDYEKNIGLGLRHAYLHGVGSNLTGLQERQNVRTP